MKMLVFAVLFLSLAAWSGAQQVTLLEDESKSDSKKSAVTDEGMPQVIAPKEEETPAATPVPVAAEAAIKPGKKIINKRKKRTAVAVSSATVKNQPVAVTPSVSASSPTVKPAAAVAVQPAPSAFPFEAVKPEEMPAAVVAVKPAAPAKPVEPVKPAAEVKDAVPVKTAEAVKPAPTAVAPVKPAPTVVAPVKPAVQAAPKPAAAVKTAVVQAPPPVAGAGFSVGKTHTVAGGETLWGLSGKYYKDPYRWGKIYNANLGTVKNPDRIYPSEELVIPDMSEEVKPAAVKTPAITGSETVKEAEFSSSDVAQPAEAAAPAAAAEPQKAASAAAPAASRTAKAELGDMLKDFDSNDLSEEMPEHQKEWASGVNIVPDSWLEDGVITAAEKGDDDKMENSISGEGEVMLVSLTGTTAVKKGDYFTAYLKGSVAFDKAGTRIGREIQQAGTLQVISVEGRKVKAKVLEVLTALVKGYVVKKK